MWKFQDIPVSRGKENSKDHFGSSRIIISIFPGSKPNIGTPLQSQFIPVRVGAILGDNKFQFGEATDGDPIASCCEHQQLLLLLQSELVYHLPEPSTVRSYKHHSRSTAAFEAVNCTLHATLLSTGQLHERHKRRPRRRM